MTSKNFVEDLRVEELPASNGWLETSGDETFQ